MTDEARPSAIRLYSSLSEPQSVLWMDRRILWRAALLIVFGIIAICFEGVIGYTPAVACFLLAYGLGSFGKRLWTYNPYFLDEYKAHLATPTIAGADHHGGCK